MAIVKATYTKQAHTAKASIRYIAHRPTLDGKRGNRILYGIDGALGRWQAYSLIDQAEQGSIYYRFVISPDPKAEDSQKDLFLRAITEQTMQHLADRLGVQISWVAAEHADHAPHRHTHVVAVVPCKLNVQDFQMLRQAATAACHDQRKERDLQREQRKEQEEGRGWK